MIFFLLIITIFFFLFITIRKFIFYKKRNYSSLYFKSAITYFTDYFYFYQIKSKSKKKDFFIISSNMNKENLLKSFTEDENFNFPDESLFSTIFIENKCFIILQCKNLIDEKNQYNSDIKKRYIRLFKRLRKNMDYFQLKGIISIKDENNSYEECNHQVLQEYFLCTELYGIYRAPIPYYSLSAINFSEDLYDVIPNFFAKKGTDLIGYTDKISADLRQNSKFKISQDLFNDFQTSIDQKKFKMLQLNLPESDLRKYLSISSILKERLIQINKSHIESLELKLEKFRLLLNSRAIFFFAGEKNYSLKNSLQALAQYPLENIKLSKNKFTFYKHSIYTGVIITICFSGIILTIFLKSLTHYISDFKNIKTNMLKMQSFNSSIDKLSSTKAFTHSCEIIENAFKFGDMSESYLFIPKSWLQKFPEPLIPEYSKQFSFFLNNNLINKFNELTDNILLLNQSGIHFNNSNFSILDIEKLTNDLKQINLIYNQINKNNPDSFQKSLFNIYTLLSENQKKNDICTFSQTKISRNFSILKNKNFKVDLKFSYNEFILKAKDKLDEIFNNILQNQFSKTYIDNLVDNFNKNSLEIFSNENSSFLFLSDQEKNIKISNLVNSYEKLNEYVNLSNELIKIQEENNSENIHNKILSYFKNSGLISDKEKETYKAKLATELKVYQSLLKKYESPIFNQNIFSFDTNNTVHINKDINFYLTHLTKSYRNMQTMDEKKVDRSQQAQSLFLNTHFLEDTYIKILNLDSVINNFAERNYPLAFNQILRDTLKYVIEMDIFANKNNLLTEIPDSNLNILANGDEELHQNILNSYKTIKPLDALIKKNNLNKVAGLIYPIIFTKINYHLENNMNKFYNLGLYTSNKHNFDNWNGESSPAQYYFSQQNEADLSSYLEKQKNLIEKFYSENMESLVQIQIALNSTFKDTSYNSTNKFWQEIKFEVIDKTRKGSLISLNDFIFNTIDKTNSTNCYQFIKKFQNIKKDEFEYFSNIKFNISNKLSHKCEDIFKIKSITEFNSLAKIFNNTLAGKFPFAKYKNSKTNYHFALIDDVIVFNQKYSLFIKDFYPFLREFHPSILNRDLKEFLSKMSNVYNFINFNKDKDSLIKYPVELEFRANRANEINGNRVISWKIESGNQKYGSNYGTPEKALLNWKVGDPLKMAFRISKSKKSNIVGREIQDISVEENNPWALLTLISQYRDCEKICNPNLLKLNFATNAGDNEIVVYFSFKILKMNTFYENVIIPEFPFFAPEIQENLNTNSDRTISLID
ncbi:hypothetical protein [Fluviispira vulneris]|uniref:hypothetical protein n=1 Tax=Fluviispira vulneris TaxID=2763012 RepID=UPI0016474B3C|nr:hypothetical protein [Fluviispira vulneris]